MARYLLSVHTKADEAPRQMTEDEMLAGFAAGASHVTHCFNAMRPFAHRDPGPIAAALTAPDVRCELIADGPHLAPVPMRPPTAAGGHAHTVVVTGAS